MDKMKANKVIINGRVYTVNEKDSIASAVALKGNKIVYVGDEEGIKSYIDENTEIIDAKGGAVFPGFMDTHMHPAMGSIPYLYEISLIGQSTVEENLTTVKAFIEEHPEMEVYTGLGFYVGAFGKEGPRKKLIDEVCSDKPVLLTSDGGHCMWINSKALEMCNITKDTESPEGGEIGKDEITGEPTGFINGVPAIDLLAGIMPKYTKEQYKKAILWYQEWFNKEGLTSLYEGILDFYKEKNIIEAYEELAKEGKLTMRVAGGWYVYPSIGSDEDIDKYMDQAEEYSNTLDTPYFQVKSYKFLMDGIIDEHTAYMIEPYCDREDGFSGECIWEYDKLKKFFKKADEKKYQIHVHQVGDASARDALNAIEYVYDENGRRDARHIFTHVQCIRDEDIDRMAALDVHATMAPYWLCCDPNYYFDTWVAKVGKDWADNQWKMKTIHEKGINVSTNCDFYVSEPNITELLYMGATRNYPQTKMDEYYGDTYKRTLNNEPPSRDAIAQLPPYDEKLDLQTLVRMSTLNAAKSNFMEKEIGSIEEGKLADIVIYGKDILNMDLEKMPYEKPVMTIFDGNVVFKAE